jgi:hypothetical protein
VGDGGRGGFGVEDGGKSKVNVDGRLGIETLREAEAEAEGEAVDERKVGVKDGDVGVDGGRLSELGDGTGGVEREYGGQENALLLADESGVDEDADALGEGVGQSKP